MMITGINGVDGHATTATAMRVEIGIGAETGRKIGGALGPLDVIGDRDRGIAIGRRGRGGRVGGTGMEVGIRKAGADGHGLAMTNTAESVGRAGRETSTTTTTTMMVMIPATNGRYSDVTDPCHRRPTPLP